MTKKITAKKKAADGTNNDGSEWVYSDVVREHFFNPKNFMRFGEEDKFKFNATGRVGSPACGDEMVIWLKIDPKTEKIKDIRWRTFGCGSAIASTSVLSEMVKEKGGMSLDKALKIKPADIMERLGGLPARKVHCSVLGDKALESAVNDYYSRTGQKSKVRGLSSKVIDEKLKITDKDIEQAVLGGARTFNDLQKKLKVSIGNPKSRLAAEELMRFYLEKYY